MTISLLWNALKSIRNIDVIGWYATRLAGLMPLPHMKIHCAYHFLRASLLKNDITSSLIYMDLMPLTPRRTFYIMLIAKKIILHGVKSIADMELMRHRILLIEKWLQLDKNIRLENYGNHSNINYDIDVTNSTLNDIVIDNHNSNELQIPLALYAYVIAGNALTGEWKKVIFLLPKLISTSLLDQNNSEKLPQWVLPFLLYAAVYGSLLDNYTMLHLMKLYTLGGGLYPSSELETNLKILILYNNMANMMRNVESINNTNVLEVNPKVYCSYLDTYFDSNPLHLIQYYMNSIVSLERKKYNLHPKIKHYSFHSNVWKSLQDSLHVRMSYSTESVFLSALRYEEKVPYGVSNNFLIIDDLDSDLMGDDHKSTENNLKYPYNPKSPVNNNNYNNNNNNNNYNNDNNHNHNHNDNNEIDNENENKNNSDNYYYLSNNNKEMKSMLRRSKKKRNRIAYEFDDKRASVLQPSEIESLQLIDCLFMDGGLYSLHYKNNIANRSIQLNQEYDEKDHANNNSNTNNENEDTLQNIVEESAIIESIVGRRSDRKLRKRSKMLTEDKNMIAPFSSSSSSSKVTTSKQRKNVMKRNKELLQVKVSHGTS